MQIKEKEPQKELELTPFRNHISLSSFMQKKDKILKEQKQQENQEKKQQQESGGNIFRSSSYFNQELQNLLQKQDEKGIKKYQESFRVQYLENKVYESEYDLLNDQLILNWDELDENYFNFARLEEKIQSEFSKNKFLEKLNRQSQEFIDSQFPQKSELIPLFDYSSSMILFSKKNYYLFDVTSDSVIYNKLGFQEKQQQLQEKQSTDENFLKLINFMQNNQETYVYRIQKISLQTFNFLKSLWNEKNNYRSLTQIFNQTLIKNHKKKQQIIDGIKDKIFEDKQFQKQREEEIDNMESMLEFLRFIGILKTFNQNFIQFFVISKEIDTFLLHIENQQKKAFNQDQYLSFTPQQIFSLKNQKNTHFIESDCVLCFSCEASSNNLVVYCNHCGKGAHTKCIDLKDSVESEYQCSSCQHKDKQDRVCHICQRKDLILLSEKKKKFGHKKKFHLFCQTVHRQAIQDEIDESSIDIEIEEQKCDLCNIMSPIHFLKKCKGKCEKIFHAFCSFMEGHYIEICNWKDQTYDDFLNNCFSYQFQFYCDQCQPQSEQLKSKFENSKFTYLELVGLNKQYRQLSLDPVYYFNNKQTIEKLKTNKQFL